MGDLCSDDKIGGFGSWCYGSNHHSVRADVVAIQGATVVVQTASGVLDELYRDAMYVSVI